MEEEDKTIEEEHLLLGGEIEKIHDIIHKSIKN